MSSGFFRLTTWLLRLPFVVPISCAVKMAENSLEQEAIATTKGSSQGR
jgi:hypothetical protein